MRRKVCTKRSWALDARLVRMKIGGGGGGGGRTIERLARNATMGGSRGRSARLRQVPLVAFRACACNHPVGLESSGLGNMI